jgi:hypothetical protein
VASRKKYGKRVWASDLDRKAASSPSSSAQIRETSDLEIPLSTPRV